MLNSAPVAPYADEMIGWERFGRDGVFIGMKGFGARRRRTACTRNSASPPTPSSPRPRRGLRPRSSGS